jgi:hypothetical protein
MKSLFRRQLRSGPQQVAFGAMFGVVDAIFSLMAESYWTLKRQSDT